MRFLLLLFACSPLTAIDIVSASREMASKIAARTGPGAVTLEVRSLEQAREDEIVAVRARLNAELRTLRVRAAEKAATAVRVTLSESLKMNVWTAEILSDGKRELLMVQRIKDSSVPSLGPRYSLERTLLFEHGAPILDVAQVPGGWAVLEPDAITMLETGKSDRRMPAGLPASPSRDLRGRLVFDGRLLQAYLPGVRCTAEINAPLSCHTSQEPWPLDGTEAALASGRNYFRRGNAEFYTSATVGADSTRTTVFANIDGRVTIGSSKINGLGSDIVGIGCDGSRHLLATSADESDALQAYRVVDAQTIAAGDPLEFSGRVTALWPLGDAAVAVVQSRATGRYAAYRVSLACGR